MVTQKNAELVKNAIHKVWRNCGQEKPKLAELLAASGRSSNTYYRALEEYPDLDDLVTTVTAVFDHRPPQAENTYDKPILTQAEAKELIERLYDVIDGLVTAVEKEGEINHQLRQQMASSVVDITPEGRSRSDTNQKHHGRSFHSKPV